MGDRLSPAAAVTLRIIHDRIVDHFDETIEPCERHALVMIVPVHTDVFLQPSRLRRRPGPILAATPRCRRADRQDRRQRKLRGIIPP